MWTWRRTTRFEQGSILAEHDRLEEDPEGLYELCERLAGHEVGEVLARMHTIGPVRVSAHVDEPRVHEHIARMLAARHLA